MRKRNPILVWFVSTLFLSLVGFVLAAGDVRLLRYTFWKTGPTLQRLERAVVFSPAGEVEVVAGKSADDDRLIAELRSVSACGMPSPGYPVYPLLYVRKSNGEYTGMDGPSRVALNYDAKTGVVGRQDGFGDDWCKLPPTFIRDVVEVANKEAAAREEEERREHAEAKQQELLEQERQSTGFTDAAGLVRTRSGLLISPPMAVQGHFISRLRQSGR